MIKIHRKEQWDLECKPWLAAHWNWPNGSKRVFCIWSKGLAIGPFLWTW